MLLQINVKNLAIVEQLELNFANGMHVITGETGAGKSIIIDALSIALGERAFAEQIRAPFTQAEVTACFDISKLPAVQNILRTQEVPCDECVIRRIISSDGRSRAYINGCSVAVQQIKELAPHLVQIHSQHQHHALLNSDYQRELLDAYAEHGALSATVYSLYAQWHTIKQQIQQLSDAQQQTDKLNLLNYQLQELTNLNLQANELTQLTQKHTQLAKGEELLANCHTINSLLSGDEANQTPGMLEQLHTAFNQLQSMSKIAPVLHNNAELLQQAIIQLQEASDGLQAYIDQLDLDPAQLAGVEERLSAIHALARKLRIAPEMLHDHYEQLSAQRNDLLQATEKLEQLNAQLKTIEAAYTQAAEQLTLSRTQAGQRLAKQIIAKLKTLEMPNAIFSVQLDPLKNNQPSAHGNESVHFMVTTNPGQPVGLLKKVASGGELSRVSLAIQVITAQKMATPTLILDEVDVGISGKTAAIVGNLMRELAQNAQIICITHLPQVAAHGHLHFKVQKVQTKQSTSTKIFQLNAMARVEELATLMGGAKITQEALAHAQQLLAESS